MQQNRIFGEVLLQAGRSSLLLLCQCMYVSDKLITAIKFVEKHTEAGEARGKEQDIARVGV
jgi:hypothetical protein